VLDIAAPDEVEEWRRVWLADLETVL
jgi:hypothetical protein